ncbi:hypothetical protein ABZ897_29270 [Nonomuraea sp. NPDC046802]|uniref:hypothetical protein n=1 Tax=Nonomuraea sp. NPDC046802 TaxID=3154919 RepID=UPI0033CD4D06
MPSKTTYTASILTAALMSVVMGTVTAAPAGASSSVTETAAVKAAAGSAVTVCSFRVNARAARYKTSYGHIFKRYWNKGDTISGYEPAIIADGRMLTTYTDSDSLYYWITASRVTKISGSCRS